MTKPEVIVIELEDGWKQIKSIGEDNEFLTIDLAAFFDAVLESTRFRDKADHHIHKLSSEMAFSDLLFGNGWLGEEAGEIVYNAVMCIGGVIHSSIQRNNLYDPDGIHTYQYAGFLDDESIILAASAKQKQRATGHYHPRHNPVPSGLQGQYSIFG